MTEAALYGVYTADFPFMELDEKKVRPVIVVSQPHTKHNLVVVVPVSSRQKQESVDCTVQNWQEAGLLRPSVARVHKPATLMQADLQLELGVLTPADQHQLKASLRSLLQLD